MSSAFNTYISSYSNEKTFMAKLIEYLENLSSDIVCTSDPDDEYPNDTSHTPTFNFKIKNRNAFSLSRGATLASGSINLVFNAIAKAGESANSQSMIFSDKIGWDQPYADSVVSRGLRVSHIVNDDFILLSFLAKNDSVSPLNNSAIFFFESNSSIFASSRKGVGSYSQANCFNISSLEFYDLDSTYANGTFISRFAHAAPAGSIDYIKSSIYQNNSQKVFENKAVYDCSTVNVASTVSLKDGAYVAVGPHQLVKVS